MYVHLQVYTSMFTFPFITTFINCTILCMENNLCTRITLKIIYTEHLL